MQDLSPVNFRPHPKGNTNYVRSLSQCPIAFSVDNLLRIHTSRKRGMEEMMYIIV
jgi:hypothetical protein